MTPVSDGGVASVGSGGRQVVTVMKADISGSTSLAERLDPEELRLVLGSYFAALAREVHRHGGVIDKYIGDAVIALFGLPEARRDDAARAVVAAVAMHEAIERENVELQRRYGVQLACRIGIATGEVIGGAIAEDVQATYTVVGPPVAMAEALESAAPLGSVLVSPATREASRGAIRFDDVAEVLPKGSTRPVRAHRVLGLRQHARGKVNIARQTMSASLQVTGGRPHVLAEERKIVTVMFADLASSEPLADKLTPERLRVVLGGYFGVLAREIQRYGGTIDKYIGDAVMAVFGAPISHEDDGARAIRAALAIQRASRPFTEMVERVDDLRVAIRIGVNTGEVVAGLLPGEVLAYTVTGDAVNTAQRVESAASPGDVLVSESTHRLAGEAFEFEAVAPLSLKGKREPVPAYRVVGFARETGTAAAGAFVGREAELALLRTYIARAFAGSGQVVHIQGEAGVGKTRVVREALAGLGPEIPRIRARVSSYEKDTPYALVAEVVRRAFGLQEIEEEPAARGALELGLAAVPADTRGGSIDVLLEILGYGQRSGLDPQIKRRLVVTILRLLLRTAAEDAPLLVLLEDLHWMDDVSASVIAELTPDIHTLHCAFLTTSRESVSWPAELLALSALEADGAAALVDSLAGPGMAADLRALILERTEGNPFFIEEMVRAVREGRTVVPTNVQELIEARLDALEYAPRHVAQSAAVIGRSFWIRVLSRVVPDDDVRDQLRVLDRAHFVQEVPVASEPTYAFRHALVQEVAYRTQLIAQRKRTHRVVGDTLEELFLERTDEFIDQFAFHYDRSDDDAKALHWCTRAGDRARALFANTEALNYYAAALRRSTDGDGPYDAGTLLERIGDVQQLAGRYADALATFGEARGRLGEPRPPTFARLERKSGQALRSQGRYDEALAAFARGSEEIADIAHPEAGWIDLAAARLHFSRGQYAEARERLRRAIEIAEDLGADEIAADGLTQLGNIEGQVGDARQAITYFQRSRQVWEQLENVKAIATLRSNLSIVYLRLGRLDEALAELEGSLVIRERVGDPWAIGNCHNNLGDVYRERGSFDEATASYAKAIDIWSRIGYAAGVALARLGLAAAFAESGRSGEAREELSAAELGFAALRSTTYLPDLYRFRAVAELAAADLDAAASAATTALDIARSANARHQIATAQRVLGEIALARGDRDEARLLLEASASALQELGELAELRRTEASLSRLGSRESG